MQPCRTQAERGNELSPEVGAWETQTRLALSYQSISKTTGRSKRKHVHKRHRSGERPRPGKTGTVGVNPNGVDSSAWRAAPEGPAAKADVAPGAEKAEATGTARGPIYPQTTCEFYNKQGSCIEMRAKMRGASAYTNDMYFILFLKIRRAINRLHRCVEAQHNDSNLRHPRGGGRVERMALWSGGNNPGVGQIRRGQARQKGAARRGRQKELLSISEKP